MKNSYLQHLPLILATFTILGVILGVTLPMLHAQGNRIDHLGIRIDQQGIRIDQLGNRLDAKIDQQGNKLDAKIDQQGARIDALAREQSQLGNRLDAKIDQQGIRIDALVREQSQTSQRLARLESFFDASRTPSPRSQGDASLAGDGSHAGQQGSKG